MPQKLFSHERGYCLLVILMFFDVFVVGVIFVGGGVVIDDDDDDVEYVVFAIAVAVRVVSFGTVALVVSTVAM